MTKTYAARYRARQSTLRAYDLAVNGIEAGGEASVSIRLSYRKKFLG